MKLDQAFYIFLLTFVLSLPAAGQTTGLGTWNVASTRITFDKSWNAFFEAQLRSQKIFNDFNYYEYKGGLGYNFKSNISVVVALGRYMTYPPFGDFTKPATNEETRLWQQLTLNNNIGRLKLEHRYRIEQRFTSFGYRNRFRYRLNAIVPFGHNTIESRTLYASLFNEIFLTNEGPYFEQNRIFGGLGYQFNAHVNILMGLINRFDHSATNVQTRKNFFQTSLIFTIAESKSGRERHPSSVD